MAKLQFPSGTTASVAEFQTMLHEMMSTANPVDDLLMLTEELRAYEQQHQMSSSTFFAAYEQGSLPEPLAHEVGWAATYDMFLRLKQKIEATLMRASLEPA
ncbi:MAG: hypothetical protein ACE5EY_15270 [Anaerolineae bacterium]